MKLLVAYFLAVLLLMLLTTATGFTQNIGIGTPTPQQKLDVNGAIKIGTTSAANEGTVRYQSGTFEGYNGSSWKAFTQLPAGTLVASATKPNAALTSSGFSFFSSVFINKDTAISTTPNTWLGVQSFNGPEQRVSHTAVWTGTKMIVWGGTGATGNLLNTGGMYDPVTDSWNAIAASPVSGRYRHTAVWTGTHMIVWGGLGPTGYSNDGAAYNPATNTWTLLTTVNAPIARHSHTAIWTGTEMIVWGGGILGDFTNTGSKYNFVTNTWTALPTTLAPSARYRHTAIWTGTRMVIWGGQYAISSSKNDGAVYNPATNTWDGPTSVLNAPGNRCSHTAIWTGTDMIVWGGFDPVNGSYNTGGKYNPSTNTWIATNFLDAPGARSIHHALWTGIHMIIYAGVDGNFPYQDGAKYNPLTDSWEYIGITNAPKVQGIKTAVWTGNQMIIYEEFDEDSNTSLGSGRYIINSEANVNILIKSTVYLFSKN